MVLLLFRHRWLHRNNLPGKYAVNDGSIDVVDVVQEHECA